MNYTKGEQELQDSIRDTLVSGGCGLLQAIELAETLMAIPKIKASSDMYEAGQLLIAGLTVWFLDPDKSPNTINEMTKPLRQALAKAEGKS